MKFTAFPEPLIMVCAEPYQWSVYADFMYYAEDAPIIIPEGFRTDLASIPRLLHWLPHLHPNGRCRRAAVVHDFLYSKSCTYRISRREADEIFRQALVDEGLGKRTAKAYYYAVRWFAGRNWRNR